MNCKWLFVIILIFRAGKSMPAQETNGAHPPSSLLYLQPAHRKALYDQDTSAFGGTSIPQFENGVIVELLDGIPTEQGRPNLLYVTRDKLLHTQIIAPVGYSRVGLTSASVGATGEIAVSGIAVDSENNRKGFVAFLRSGQDKAEYIFTDSFLPSRLCVSPDDSAWVLGDIDPVVSSIKPGRAALANYGVVRHIGPSLSESADVLPRNKIRGNLLNAWNVGRHVYLKAYFSGFLLLDGVNREVFVFDPHSWTLSEYAIAVSEDLPDHVNGIAVTTSGQVFASIAAATPIARSEHGMFKLDLDERKKIANWVPLINTQSSAVPDGKNPESGKFLILLGEDGEDIVYRNYQQKAFPVEVLWSSY